MNYEDLDFLDISGFYLLLWTAYYTSNVSDDWQSVAIDCSGLVLTIQLTFQDLSFLRYLTVAALLCFAHGFHLLAGLQGFLHVYICYVAYW